MIQTDELLIRKMTHHDYPLMVEWLNNPEVLNYYEEPPSSLERIAAKYGPRIDGNHYVTPCIVEVANLPIGYMQYYPIQRRDYSNYSLDADSNYFGIDQFIGEPELWGQGLGTQMIQAMLLHLKDLLADGVVLEVKKSNSRAIKSYQKCGFEITKELNDECYVMACIFTFSNKLKPPSIMTRGNYINY